MGSIPACAGEPPHRQRRVDSDWVYPRVCGGTREAAPCTGICTGLSPRVRGNPTPCLPRACQGRVYPRVCGGTLRGVKPTYAQAGLSPRVRGNQPRRQHPDQPPGSIPACAGEPCRRARRCTRSGVYPRVCGGTRRDHRRPSVRLGLSPRVRGNLDSRGDHADARGSIPACAGEPPGPIGAAAPCRVYPRVCGGTMPSMPRAVEMTGLSPRVRGNRPHPQLGVCAFGSIPACAGEPSAAPTR